MAHDPDRDLVAALRAELASIEPARRCCRRAELAGLGAAAQGKARTPVIGRLAVRLEGGATTDGFEWDSAAGHCRIAYLRGLVLARGSISLGQTGTHLELVVPADELESLADRFAALGFAAGSRLRRGRGVLTWKDAEAILGLLRRLGASVTTLELETRFVARSLRGHMNRVVNAEHANLRRQVEAARRQLAQIDLLEQMHLTRRLSRHARQVAEQRRRAPEQTFSELSATIGLSRSKVQRAFDEIELAALHATDAA